MPGTLVPLTTLAIQLRLTGWALIRVSERPKARVRRHFKTLATQTLDRNRLLTCTHYSSRKQNWTLWNTAASPLQHISLPSHPLRTPACCVFPAMLLEKHESGLTSCTFCLTERHALSTSLVTFDPPKENASLGFSDASSVSRRIRMPSSMWQLGQGSSATPGIQMVTLQPPCVGFGEARVHCCCSGKL